MTFEYTPEQLAIFDEFITPTNPILAIKAVAGASKTTTLIEAASRFKQIYPSATVRYLIFGSTAADEARIEFGSNAIVSTLHAYAYHFTVKPYKLGEVKPFLTWRDIPKSIKRPFGTDSDILAILDEYCLSDFISLAEFAKSKQNVPDYPRRLFPQVKLLLNTMAQGQMPCTHSFYLKLFHVFVVHGTIQLPSVDRLLVDEFQDMSGLALDIINRIPATHRTFVGDDNQSIFTFLNLQNGFAMYPEAKVLTLSKSFRVHTRFAPAIQAFLRKHLDPTAVFEGMEYPDNIVPVTKAYLTRSNASLIAKMIELNKAHIPYHLSSKTKLRQMFKLPLALAYAKAGHDQRDPELKHLQHDIDDYYALPKQQQEQTGLFKYLKAANPGDSKLQAAINLLLQFPKQDIIDAFEHADDHKNKPCNLQLMTAHNSKGITRDIIELDEDINKSVLELLDIPMDQLTEDERSELCLAFVSCTRHRHRLINCKFLKELE